MKSLVVIALVAVLGALAAHAYSPRKFGNHESKYRPSSESTEDYKSEEVPSTHSVETVEDYENKPSNRHPSKSLEDFKDSSSQKSSSKSTEHFKDEVPLKSSSGSIEHNKRQTLQGLGRSTDHHGRPHHPDHGFHGPHLRPRHGHFRPWDHSTEWHNQGPHSREHDDDSSGSFGVDSDDWSHEPHHHFPRKNPCKHNRHCKYRTTTQSYPRTSRRPPQTSKYPPQNTRYPPPHTNRPLWNPTTNTRGPSTTSNPTTTWYTSRPTSKTDANPDPLSSTDSITGTTKINSEENTTQGITVSVPEIVTITNEREATLSPEIAECIRDCPTTPEYNPVCGTDGETYINEGSLYCAKSCGVDVNIHRRSSCPPPPPPTEDNTGSPTAPPTTSTTTAFRGRTIFSRFEQCMRQCLITNGVIKPVCGSDFITYMNVERLKCAVSCGKGVEIICDKPCAACGFNPPTPSTPVPTTVKSTTTAVGKITLEPDIKDCIDTCPMTSEDNPICGTNNITYKNPSYLLCAQMCGVDVKVLHFKACFHWNQQSTMEATTSSPTNENYKPTLSPELRSCIRGCPVTSQYVPVCGTDNLTYKNIGHLDCAKFCGVEVELKYKSRCEGDSGSFVDPALLTTSQSTNIIMNPDVNLTTPSTTLITDQNPSVTTKLESTTTTVNFSIPSDILAHVFGSTTVQPPDASITTFQSMNNEGSMNQMTTSSSSKSTEPTPIPTVTTKSGLNLTTTLGFTLPPDIFHDIFNVTTVPSPVSVKTPNPDDDEDLNLNPRFDNVIN